MQKVALDSWGQPINIWVADEPKKQSKNARRKAKRYAMKFKKITARAKSGKDNSGLKYEWSQYNHSRRICMSPEIILINKGY